MFLYYRAFFVTSSLALLLLAPGAAAAPLGAPTGLTPPTYTLDTTPTFSWTPVPDAIYYRLAVQRLNGSYYYNPEPLPSNTFYTPTTPLQQGQCYNWWVRAERAIGDYGPWSAKRSVCISNPLGTPTGLTPAGSTLDTTPTFSWTAVAGANYYRLAIRRMDGSYYYNPEPLPVTNFHTPVTPLQQGECYDWWVRAELGIGFYGSWSSKRTVCVIGRPSCNCYFVSDCAGKTFCNYGPGGYMTEDICTWRDNKPQGIPGTGCDVPHSGPWGGQICDGICTAYESGSMLGHEDPATLAQGVRLWAQAILGPAEVGDAVDPLIAEQAQGLPYHMKESGWILGRHVADALAIATDFGFYDHFCHFEHDMQDPELFVDLSGDPCQRDAGWLVTDALAAEIESPGSGLDYLDLIPTYCSRWATTYKAPRCNTPTKALQCVRERVNELARFLTTPAEVDLQLPLKRSSQSPATFDRP